MGGEGRRGRPGSRGMGGWETRPEMLGLCLILYMMYEVDLWFAQGYKLEEQIKT
jgi:hypothetical protein